MRTSGDAKISRGHGWLGYAAGALWISACISALEVVGRKNIAAQLYLNLQCVNFQSEAP